MLPAHDAKDDPMVEEFVASLATSWVIMCPPLGPVASTPVATHLEDGATTMVMITYICSYEH
jgi:hypothetical protein